MAWPNRTGANGHRFFNFDRQMTMGHHDCKRGPAPVAVVQLSTSGGVTRHANQPDIMPRGAVCSGLLDCCWRGDWSVCSLVCPSRRPRMVCVVVCRSILRRFRSRKRIFIFAGRASHYLDYQVCKPESQIEMRRLPEAGAESALDREHKMLVSNDFRKPPHRFGRVHLDIALQEQAVAY